MTDRAARHPAVTEGQIIGLSRRMQGEAAQGVEQAMRDLEYLVGVAIE